VIPDVPITAVFLILYLIFGVIHIKIFKANKGRGHKFIFNGAILGRLAEKKISKFSTNTSQDSARSESSP